MIEAVDLFLRKQEIPIHARPMRGLHEIFSTLKLGLSLSRRSKKVTDKGVFTGDDLTIRIFDWFDARYGKKLAIRVGPGRIALLIRGDPWEVFLPEIWGTVEFFISADEKSSNQDDDLRLRRIPRANILDGITDFPEGLFKSLSAEELYTIAHNFVMAYKATQSISQIKKLPMLNEIRNDIDSSVNQLLSRPPHYGLSKWSSLQVVEKSFKVYLLHKGLDFPRHHRLHDLSQIAEHNGMSPVDRNLIDRIQCSADVRYGDENVSKEDAHVAHLLSILLAGQIADNITATMT